MSVVGGSDSFRRGVWLAVLAAIAFGASTPFVHRFGAHTGAFFTASCLYFGAAAGALFSGARSSREAPVERRHWPRLLGVALVGALFAPVLLAWGLRHCGAANASLLLNFEAVFTVIFSALLYREQIGRRVALAVMLMLGAGTVLGWNAHALGAAHLLGSLAIVAATAGWALDNTLARPLAELDPAQVVRWKGVLGGSCGLGLALLQREPSGGLAAVLGLASSGFVGYGLSLRLYLRAQRAIGAGRTGSIFALAPFVGVVAAWLMGDRAIGLPTFVAAALFLLALYLHVTERHEHWHTHDSLEHEHAHNHDDGHHEHVHEPPVVGEHSHPHRHAPQAHSHTHAPDLHHRHGHE